MGVGVDGENSAWGGPAFCDAGGVSAGETENAREGKCGRGRSHS